jgi:hypothetical protein
MARATNNQKGDDEMATRNKKDRRGEIITITSGFVVNKYDGRRLRFHKQYEWPAKSAPGAHLEAVKAVARLCFDQGVLVREGCTEIPHPNFDKWGFSRDLRPFGQVSVIVDHYMVY